MHDLVLSNFFSFQFVQTVSVVFNDSHVSHGLLDKVDINNFQMIWINFLCCREIVWIFQLVVILLLHNIRDMPMQLLLKNITIVHIALSSGQVSDLYGEIICLDSVIFIEVGKSILFGI